MSLFNPFYCLKSPIFGFKHVFFDSACAALQISRRLLRHKYWRRQTYLLLFQKSFLVFLQISRRLLWHKYACRPKYSSTFLKSSRAIHISRSDGIHFRRVPRGPTRTHQDVRFHLTLKRKFKTKWHLWGKNSHEIKFKQFTGSKQKEFFWQPYMLFLPGTVRRHDNFFFVKKKFPSTKKYSLILRYQTLGKSISSRNYI